MERYKNLVYSVPLKYGVPHQDAADIFQAVWIELFNELPRLREAAALQGWLIRVAAHKCYHWKRERQPDEQLEVEEIESRQDGDRITPDLMAELEREQMLRDAIGALAPRCREMIELLFFEHPPLRYVEVARRLRLAPGSIGFIRGRCLKRLKQALEEKGF